VEPRQLLATFTVSSVADSGPNTLRQAILDSNATPGANTIRFSIPAPGPYSIAPVSDLPAITNTVTIDGTTQAGSVPGSPIVELNGSLDTGSGNTGNGLTINAPGCTIRGLVINRFNGFGIALGNVSGVTIAGNDIGTNPAGTVAEGNRSGGINAGGSTAVMIGGLTPADRNVISGNLNDGIDFLSFSGLPTGNLVVGNFIGTDATGTRGLPNSGNGVFVNSTGNQIGGVAPGQANVIADNGLAGVRVGTFNTETGVTSNPIRGNAIFGNNALGIDLGNSGVTLNGSFGTGFGPNRLQSFPVINSAYPSGTGTMIEGQLASTPNSSFILDFYANDAADPSGFGQGQRFLGASPVMTNPDGVVTFTATLPAGVTPGQFLTATATDRDGNTSEFSQATSVTPTALADLAIALSGSPNPVLAGSNLTYTVFVANKGPSRATNTTIVDALPPGVTFVSATPSQGTFAVSGGVLTANLGTLSPGAGATLQLVVQPTTEGALANTASVKSDQTDPEPQNDMATVNTTVNPAVPADLSVVGFASPSQVSVGDELTYTLVVVNNGPSAQAAGVVLTDMLPAGATLVSATPSQGTFAVSGGTLTANLGSLAFGANATVQIVVRPTSAGRLTNVATVRGAQSDPNALNNTSTLVTSVTPAASADLAVAVLALPNPVNVGRPLTYSIYVTNNGPGDDGGVTLIDELDSGVTFVSANASQGTVASSGGLVTANLGTLVSGQTVLVSVVVRPTAIGILSNTATVQGDQPDFVPVNNQAAISSLVLQNATGPTILAQRLITSRKAITGIVLTFSAPMDPVQAEALNNYSIRLAGKNGLPGNPEGPTIPLASAQYNASRRTVTLTPVRPLSLGQFYQFLANGPGSSGLTDTSGNVLDGDQNGVPDGIYQSYIGRGTSVRPLAFQVSQVVPIPPPHSQRKPPLFQPRPTPHVQLDVAITRTFTKHVIRST
jgi:uncharacterized repeat protein (TIGR01451 family)